MNFGLTILSAIHEKHVSNAETSNFSAWPYDLWLPVIGVRATSLGKKTTFDDVLPFYSSQRFSGKQLVQWAIHGEVIGGTLQSDMSQPGKDDITMGISWQ